MIKMEKKPIKFNILCMQCIFNVNSFYIHGMQIAFKINAKWAMYIKCIWTE
jgi:hypothetical protein